MKCSAAMNPSCCSIRASSCKSSSAPVTPGRNKRLSRGTKRWWCNRDDLEQVRILADQCRRREKLRKRALTAWQQDMHALLQQAISLDHRLLGTSDLSPAAKQAKLTAKQASHKPPSSSKAGHSKAANSKQAQQLAAEVADATENAQAKFEHDMALSLQLTRGVAEEAAKLHHVKIVRAESSQAAEEGADVAGPSDAVESALPTLTPADHPPSSQPGASPGRLTRSMQAQATPSAAISDPPLSPHQSGANSHAGAHASLTRSNRSAQAAGLNSPSASVLQSAPQDASTAAETAGKRFPSSAGTAPGKAQSSPSKSSPPAPSPATVSSALLSPRRDTAGESRRAAAATEAAAAGVGSSPQRVTRSPQASVGGRSDGATPSANKQAQMQPTQASHTHRQTRSMQGTVLHSLSSSDRAQSSSQEEAEQAGASLDPAGPLEVEVPSGSQPTSSSSSTQRRRRSSRCPVATPSPHAEMSHGAASGAAQQGQVQISPKHTRSLRAKLLPVLSQQGGKRSVQRKCLLHEYSLSLAELLIVAGSVACRFSILTYRVCCLTAPSNYEVCVLRCAILCLVPVFL